MLFNSDCHSEDKAAKAEEIPDRATAAEYGSVTQTSSEADDHRRAGREVGDFSNDLSGTCTKLLAKRR